MGRGRPIRVGLYLSAQHPPGADPAAALAEHVAQVRAARECGFDAVFAPQHFLSHPYQMFQHVPLLARLAAEADGMRLGLGILLLTLLNPVEVAECVATLDVISGGRAVLGVGLGYRPEESDAFGLPAGRERVFREKLDVVRRLLEGEAVTAAGHGYRLAGARLALRPLQRPRPPIWLAANRDAAVARAARSADTWLVNPHAAVGELERQVALFRRERGVAPAELPVVREVCVAPTDAEAEETARPHLEGKYGRYVRWGQDEAMPDGDTLRRRWDDLRAERFIVGGPETALAEIRGLRDRLGATLLLARVQWPGLPHADAMRTLRLLATDVMPGLA
ncbi:MAG: LLM class flavin-dependent oxidoreductase [Actinomycetota bacterium]